VREGSEHATRCTGGRFSNPDGRALTADELTVDGDMFCDEGFSATGEVRLLGAHVGGQFANPDGSAFNLWRATVSGPLFMDSAILEGILDLAAAKTSSYHDKRAFWLQTLRQHLSIGDYSSRHRPIAGRRPR